MNIVQHTGNFLLDLVFPKFCLSCARLGSYFCIACRRSTPYQLIQRCIACQKPALEGFTHPKCTSKYKPDRLLSLYDYRIKPIAELIITGKYQFIPEIFEILGTSFAEFLFNNPAGFDRFVITTIPLSKRRLRWRGFNQADLIAEAVALKCNMQLMPLLRRAKHTLVQKDLNRLQRLHNLKNAFEFTSETVPEKVMLVDDVVTTGTTLLEATGVLKRAGVKQVWCLAAAQD